jgi:superfamily II DNA helicase RecQ
LWGPDDETALARTKTEANRNRVSALLHYARDTVHCRRHSLLALLNYDAGGEVPENLCCDVCENKAENTMREESSALAFIQKNKRRFTAGEAASVLAASNTVRCSEEDASLVINYLLKTGKLKNKRFPWKGKITL